MNENSGLSLAIKRLLDKWHPSGREKLHKQYTESLRKRLLIHVFNTKLKYGQPTYIDFLEHISFNGVKHVPGCNSP